MRRYPEYKSSGVEWLGDVPGHWDAVKIKYAADLTNDEADAERAGFRVALENIESKTGRYLGSDNTYAGAGTGFRAGDVLFSKLRPYLAKVYEADRDGVSVGELLVLRPRNGVDSRFLFYRLLSADLISVVDGSTYGTKMPRANWDFIGNFGISLPPLDEQRQLAAYLDRKTGEIDALIARKQALIALLREQRTALIHRAVTKGLDPDVPMKDSGVEWLGEVPGHWNVAQLRYVADLGSGNGITSESIEPRGTYPVYGGNGIRGYTMDYTHEGHFALIGRQGALCGNINFASGRFWASEHAVVVTPRGENRTVWLGNLLRSMKLGQYSVAAAQPGISVEAIKALRIPVPPVNEQAAIEHFISAKSDTIKSVMSREEQLIERLRELRTALISEVVTGQMDVRAQAPAPPGTGASAPAFHPLPTPPRPPCASSSKSPTRPNSAA